MPDQIYLQNSMQLHARRFTATFNNIKVNIFLNKQISEAGVEITAVSSSLYVETSTYY